MAHAAAFPRTAAPSPPAGRGSCGRPQTQGAQAPFSGRAANRGDRGRRPCRGRAARRSAKNDVCRASSECSPACSGVGLVLRPSAKLRSNSGRAPRRSARAAAGQRTTGVLAPLRLRQSKVGSRNRAVSPRAARSPGAWECRWRRRSPRQPGEAAVRSRARGRSLRRAPAQQAAQVEVVVAHQPVAALDRRARSRDQRHAGEDRARCARSPITSMRATGRRHAGAAGAAGRRSCRRCRCGG